MLLFCALSLNRCFTQDSSQPNILLIVCDDLNHMGLGTLVDPILHTPNIDSLVSVSHVFTNAHANVAGCGPSRASMFSGLLPQTSGHSGYKMSENSWINNPVLANTTSVFKQFLQNGYDVYGSGKVYHADRYKPEDFTDYYTKPTQGPIVYANAAHPDLPVEFGNFNVSFAALESVPTSIENRGWRYPDNTPFRFEDSSNRDLMGDEVTVNYCDSIMNLHASDSASKPFFLTAGFFKPHEPFHLPQQYFDLYDTSQFDYDFLIPQTSAPSATSITNRYNLKGKAARDLMMNIAPEEDPMFYMRSFIHGYYASISYLDDQIGRLNTLLKKYELAENTIIIFTSDHGFQLGDKGFIKKCTLWNSSTAIPLVIHIPGETTTEFNMPVSLIDLYPTLLDLAGIPEPDEQILDGKSLLPVIHDGAESSAILYAVSNEFLGNNEPAKVGHSHHALIYDDFKYIAYSSGEDELYNLASDFYENHNLVSDPDYQGIRNKMYRKLIGKIGSLKPPLPGYECFYYGDFSQTLNGWHPSEPDETIYTISGNDALPTDHLYIPRLLPAPIKNNNIKFSSSGEHTFRFKAYSENSTSKIRFKLREKGTVLFDSIFTIDTLPKIYTLPFSIQGEPPLYGDCILEILPIKGKKIHLDDVKIQNDFMKNESLSICLYAYQINRNLPLDSLNADSLLSGESLSPIACSTYQGGVDQYWRRFSPLYSSGIIAVEGTNEVDPVVEIISDCELDGEIEKCIDHRSDKYEYLYLSDLTPGTEQFVRFSNLNDTNDGINTLKNVFIDAKPMEFSFENDVVLCPESYLSLEHQMAVDLPFDYIRFMFIDENTDETFDYLFNLTGPVEIPMYSFNGLPEGYYSVKALYRLKNLPVNIPWGPEKRFFFKQNCPDNLSQPSLLIYPNPIEEGSENLYLAISEQSFSKNSTIRIFDFAGRLVKESKPYSESDGFIVVSNIGNLSKGSYLLCICNEENCAESTLLLVH